jgi:hypothetical protein
MNLHFLFVFVFVSVPAPSHFSSVFVTPGWGISGYAARLEASRLRRANWRLELPFAWWCGPPAS